MTPAARLLLRVRRLRRRFFRVASAGRFFGRRVLRERPATLDAVAGDGGVGFRRFAGAAPALRPTSSTGSLGGRRRRERFEQDRREAGALGELAGRRAEHDAEGEHRHHRDAATRGVGMKPPPGARLRRRRAGRRLLLAAAAAGSAASCAATARRQRPAPVHRTAGSSAGRPRGRAAARRSSRARGAAVSSSVGATLDASIAPLVTEL